MITQRGASLSLLLMLPFLARCAQDTQPIGGNDTASAGTGASGGAAGQSGAGGQGGTAGQSSTGGQGGATPTAGAAGSGTSAAGSTGGTTSQDCGVLTNSQKVSVPSVGGDYYLLSALPSGACQAQQTCGLVAIETCTCGGDGTPVVPSFAGIEDWSCSCSDGTWACTMQSKGETACACEGMDGGTSQAQCALDPSAGTCTSSNSATCCAINGSVIRYWPATGCAQLQPSNPNGVIACDPRGPGGQDQCYVEPAGSCYSEMNADGSVTYFYTANYGYPASDFGADASRCAETDVGAAFITQQSNNKSFGKGALICPP